MHFLSAAKSLHTPRSEPLHGAEVRLHNSPGHAPRSVYGLGPPSRRPGGSRNPPESPVLTAQPPRYSSPAAPRDMSPGHRRERRFKRPQRYRRASARPQYLPKCLPESGGRARRTPRPSRPRALQRSVAISACGAPAPLRGNALPPTLTSCSWIWCAQSQYCIVLVRNRDNGSVPASRRPSVQADPQGMQPG